MMAQCKARYLQEVTKAPATPLLKSTKTKKNLMYPQACPIYTRRGVRQT